MLSRRLLTNGSWLLALLVFSTIFERFNIFLEPFDFSLKLSLVLLPVVGLILLIKKKLTFNPTFLFPFLAAVLGVEVLSTFFSYNRIQSFQVVVFHILMLGLFYLFVWAVPAGNHHPRSPVRPPEADSGPPRRWRKATWWPRHFTWPDGLLRGGAYGWIAGAFVVSLYGIWQFVRFAGGQSPAIFLDELLPAKSLSATAFVHEAFGKILLRPSSTFIDVNTAASFVGIAILLGLGFLLRKRWVFWVVVIATLSTFFLMALSRSALFGFGIGLTAFVVLNLWGRVEGKRLAALVFLFLALLGGGVGYLSVYQEARRESTVARVEYVQGAVEMFRSAPGGPLLGVGVGNFEAYYTEVLQPTEAYGYSHSILLTWLGETGILGFLANLALIGVVVLALVRETLRHHLGTQWRLRLSALLSAFVALVAANLFHAHYGLEFTWVLLGLCVSGYYLAKNSKFEIRNSKLNILGVGIDNVTMGEAIAWVKRLLRQKAKSKKQKAYVVTPNPEMVMEAQRDAEFARILNEAGLATPDGIGLVWASRILGTPLKERVSGTDLFLELVAEVAREGGRIFLLGGEEGIAKKAARALKKRYPKLRIVGTFAGDGSPRGDEETVAAVREVVGRTKQPNNQTPPKAGPPLAETEQPIDLLFVAYGHGKQERWISRNLAKVPVKVAIGVGGAFDYIAGEVPRAPLLIRRLGFEWLYRLIRQPHRFRRQLLLFPFSVLVFKEALRDL